MQAPAERKSRRQPALDDGINADGLDKLTFDEILEMFRDKQGALQLQKAFKKTDTAFLLKCLAAIAHDFEQIAKDKHGNYVLAAMVKATAQTGLGLSWFIRKAAGNLDSLAKHCVGCRIIQRLYENCIPDMMNPISKKLLGMFDDLVNSKYGKHVIQCLTQLQPYKQIVEVLLAKKLNAYLLSRNACLVVEYAIDGSSPWFAKMVSQECAQIPLRCARYVRRKVINTLTHNTWRKAFV